MNMRRPKSKSTLPAFIKAMNVPGIQVVMPSDPPEINGLKVTHIVVDELASDAQALSLWKRTCYIIKAE